MINVGDVVMAYECELCNQCLVQITWIGQHAFDGYVFDVEQTDYLVEVNKNSNSSFRLKKCVQWRFLIRDIVKVVERG